MLSPVRSSPVIVKGGRSIKVGMANVNSLVVTRCLLFVCQSFCLICVQFLPAKMKDDTVYFGPPCIVNTVSCKR